jgi:hypothetical protein
VQEDDDLPPDLVDVVIVASLLLDDNEGKLDEIFAEDPSCLRLGIGKNAASGLMSAYRDKLQSLQQSLS